MKKFSLMLLLAGQLAGCATEEMRREIEQSRINALEDRCAAYGFQRGSPQIASCMQQLDMANRQADDASTAQMLQGLQMMNQQPVFVPQQQPSGMNCRRMPNGSVDCITR